MWTWSFHHDGLQTAAKFKCVPERLLVLLLKWEFWHYDYRRPSKIYWRAWNHLFTIPDLEFWVFELKSSQATGNKTEKSHDPGTTDRFILKTTRGGPNAKRVTRSLCIFPGKNGAPLKRPQNAIYFPNPLRYIYPPDSHNMKPTNSFKLKLGQSEMPYSCTSYSSRCLIL